jgi:hypothetical protein
MKLTVPSSLPRDLPCLALKIPPIPHLALFQREHEIVPGFRL